MPVFYILIFLAALLIIAFLSGYYKPIGEFVYQVFKDAKDAVLEEDKNEDKKE